MIIAKKKKSACATCGYKPLLDILNLPENMKVVTAGLMVGFPKYTYKRLVDRNPLQVTWGK
ncbi:hypothetical protein BCD96_003586 [Clostridium beijerinckii]|nr:hypothetical protein [Clostridium beijerinckii]NRT36254.1 hypothetical protein [Clostridium beijerinckii]NRT44318.1 hypothetical protein [Clostridium beijerinckii]NRU38028.1 hypothetical protein [Clostridium beijerinckii]NRY59290.1 hypothetical protein [Clostridium beijerinckii]